MKMTALTRRLCSAFPIFLLLSLGSSYGSLAGTSDTPLSQAATSCSGQWQAGGEGAGTSRSGHTSIAGLMMLMMSDRRA